MFSFRFKICRSIGRIVGSGWGISASCVFISLSEYEHLCQELLQQKEEHSFSTCTVLAQKLDKRIAKRRLLTDGKIFLDNPDTKPRIEENWRFLFQESLFPKKKGEKSR